MTSKTRSLLLILWLLGFSAQLLASGFTACPLEPVAQSPSHAGGCHGDSQGDDGEQVKITQCDHGCCPGLCANYLLGDSWLPVVSAGEVPYSVDAAAISRRAQASYRPPIIR